MQEYKRLTKKGGWHDSIDLKDEYGYKWIYSRLAELEDKIENGTLVDITKEYYFITNNIRPTIVKSPLILGFNRMQGIVRYVDNEPRCICANKAEAEAKLKELQNERVGKISD